MHISVIVNCYHKEEFLEECVESCIRQSIRPSEIILVHDGCEAPMHHLKCKTVMLPRNVGVAKARDIGFQNSKGDLILFVDGDDVLSPDYIEKMWRANTDIAYPDLFVWSIYGENRGKNGLYITKKVTPKSLLSIHSIVPVTSMMKREVYLTLGGFSDMEVFEDWEFWLRAMEKGFRFKKAETLLWYRQSVESRNRRDDSIRRAVFEKMTEMYEVKGDRLCLKT